MSDTPRNDKLTDQTVGCSDALHLVLVDELSRNLERELAAVTQELAEVRRQVDVLVEAVHVNWCPPGVANCMMLDGDGSDISKCRACWSAWAAQQAKEGGGK